MFLSLIHTMHVRLRLCVHLCQMANITSMGCFIKRKEWVHRTHSLHLRQIANKNAKNAEYERYDQTGL